MHAQIMGAFVANVCWMYVCVVNVCCYECISCEFINVTSVCLYVWDVIVCCYECMSCDFKNVIFVC